MRIDENVDSGARCLSSLSVVHPPELIGLLNTYHLSFFKLVPMHANMREHRLVLVRVQVQ